MKKGEKSGSVRRYNKSQLPRLRWTPELHQHFVDAVQHLGGKYKATPKRILQMMSVNGLQISHVKSHLQMYRTMKLDRKGKAIHLTNLPMFWVCSPHKMMFSERRACQHEGKEFQGQVPWRDSSEITSTRENFCGYVFQDTIGGTLSEMSKEEDVESQNESCDLSPIFPQCERERNHKYPFKDYGNSQASLTRLHYIGENQINLDLTISTSFSNSS
ncbi:Myb family transcription factor [Actinidia chinensis var. chinensis]|uniref:Myb family transcription factor n=1 Tax=Actinidia chinensis var. chinensis TaxID=1590841 RepID=A0A2R6PU32_ACTCC|nr:Myb family transcription factor [Actinidia chinensis var. chinensis]